MFAPLSRQGEAERHRAQENRKSQGRGGGSWSGPTKRTEEGARLCNGKQCWIRIPTNLWIIPQRQTQREMVRPNGRMTLHLSRSRRRRGWLATVRWQNRQTKVLIKPPRWHANRNPATPRRAHEGFHAALPRGVAPGRMLSSYTQVATSLLQQRFVLPCHSPTQSLTLTLQPCCQRLAACRSDPSEES